MAESCVITRLDIGQPPLGIKEEKEFEVDWRR